MGEQRTNTEVHIIRTTPDLSRRLRRAAKREKRPMTELWRQALEMYLERENGAK